MLYCAKCDFVIVVFFVICWFDRQDWHDHPISPTTISNWPQLRRAPIKFGRFIKLYSINVKVLYKQTDMGFAAEAGYLGGGGKGGISPQKKV